MDKRGNFVVTWMSNHQADSKYDVYAQRYNKKGEPLGLEFQVNSYTTDEQDSPAIIIDKAGNFIISWSSKRQDGSKNGVFAQRFDKTGKPLGTEFQVNTYTLDHQMFPDMAMDSRGNFIITWVSLDQDGSEFGVFAQLFNKKGVPSGVEFQVNTYTDDFQNFPAVGMDKKGNFAITWMSKGQNGPSNDIYAKTYKK
jgi:hypothetical protein